MQKRAEQNTNIKEGNYYSLLEFHALGDHQIIYICILLDVLFCSIAEYFYELCRILASP